MLRAEIALLRDGQARQDMIEHLAGEATLTTNVSKLCFESLSCCRQSLPGVVDRIATNSVLVCCVQLCRTLPFGCQLVAGHVVRHLCHL